MIKRRRENRGLLRSGKSRSKDGKEWKCSAIGTILPQQTMGFEPAMQVWINPRYYINNSLTVRWSGWPQSEWEGRWQQPERERSLSIYTSWGPTETDEAEVSVYVTPSVIEASVDPAPVVASSSGRFKQTVSNNYTKQTVSNNSRNKQSLLYLNLHRCCCF